jgi:hypothetical protein
MKRFTQLLAVVLVVQVLLAVYTHQFSKKEASASTPLIQISGNAVSSLHINEKNKDELVLTKEDGKWVLPDLFGAEADTGMIESVLEKIEGLKRSWPVAASSSAAVRFHVAKDDFKQKINLQLTDGNSVVFCVGDSAGAKTSYLRFNDNNEIYRAPLNAYDFPSDPNMWIDGKQLNIDEKSVASIQFNNVMLKRKDNVFMPDLADKGNLNKDKISEVIADILKPHLNGILGMEEQPAYNLNEPALNVTIIKNDGTKIEYEYGKPEKEDYYVLKSSDNDYFFKVGVWQADELIKTTPKSLVKEDTKSDKIEAAAVAPAVNE